MKYHINRQGVAAPCHATLRACPYGEHFDSLDEAQNYFKKKNTDEFGVLPKNGNLFYSKITSDSDKEYALKRIEELKDESPRPTYIERCKYSERILDYSPNGKNTAHMENERSWKDKKLDDLFGEGTLVGHYKVNHKLGKSYNAPYKTQIVEVRDNGRITIYDYNRGHKVTTFMGHRARIEAMMILANEIPNQDFLTRVIENRILAEKENLS